MKKNSNIKTAGMLYLVGNLFSKGIAFLTVPVFTRILSTSDYGIVTTYNSWVSILNMIIGCALTMGVRASFIDYEKDANKFISAVVRFTSIIGTIAMIIVVGLCDLFNVNRPLILLIGLCFLHGMFWAIIDDYSQYLMMKYEYKARTILMVLPNLISSVLSIVVILNISSSDLYLGRIIPSVLVYVIIGLCVIKKSYIQITKEEFVTYIKYALRISLPLVVHGIALNVLAQSDRTMITILADSSQTGIYSLIYNFSMLAMVLTTALDGIWVPFFIDNLKKRDIKIINDKSRIYIELMTTALIELVLVGPEIVKLLAEDSYWQGITIIPPIVLSNYLIFIYTLCVNIEHYYKKTVCITLFTAIAAIINLGLNYLLIPRYGYFAAAYTTLFSYFVTFILHYINSKKLECKLFPLKSFLIPFVEVILSVVGFYVFINYPLIRWLLAVAYFLFQLFINRTALKAIVMSKRGRKDW